MIKLLLLAMLLNSRNIYAKPVQVTAVDAYTVYTDNNGDMWAVGDRDSNLNIGDNCILIMDSKGTTDIYDDEIIFVVKH